MILHKSQLNALLTQYNIQTSSLDILWEVDENIVYGIILDGSNAIETWRQLYEIISKTQHYPVLLGSKQQANCYIDCNFPKLAEYSNQTLTANEIINIGNSLNTEQWLIEVEEERREEWDFFYPEEYEAEEAIEYYIFPRVKYSIHQEVLIQEPYKEVVIALVPTIFSWEVPAFLKFGNWNDCPETEVQVALMKRWYELYEAEVVGISNDVVEMQVKNPPKDMVTSLRLAKEQYIYCHDIVSQGVQTIQNLAASLLESKIWYFWWD